MRSEPTEPGPGLRVRAFLLLDAWRRRGIKTLEVVHQGLWLGLMDRRRLERLGDWHYRRRRRYLDPEYNRTGLRGWEERAIAEHLAGRRRVLVAATGGGRELLALARRGHRTSGFDCLEELVACARRLLAEEGFEPDVVLAPASEVPEGLAPVDGVLIGWGAYIHIPGRALRVRFLTGLRRLLPPGAPLVVSFLVRPEGASSYRWIAAIGNPVRWLRRCRERVEVGDTLPETFDHHFSRDEIAGELEEAGFELVAFTAEPFGYAVGRAREVGAAGPD